MRKGAGKYYFIVMMVFVTLKCKKPYEPAVLISGNNYLVIDGFINTSANGITNIVLSRTKNLTDTVINIPEHNAKISVQNAAGTSYPLQEQGNDGSYVSNPLVLGNTSQYKILVTTADGKRYASDLTGTKQAPPVDSVSWQQDTLGVHVFVNTHDPSNNTRYYRWTYIQTWEYHAQLQTAWGLTGNKIYALDPFDQIWICYRTTPSTNVFLGTSAALSRDVISMMPLFSIPKDDTTLAQRMSIEVKQYALSPQAYAYWQIIQKNSEQLGTLFDLQPSQLEGNIHCIDNPSEPVVGFMTAGTEEQKRIFISVFDLVDWRASRGSYNCSIKTIGQDPNDFSNWTYPDPTYLPYYFAGGGALIIAKNVCLDCRLSGGTLVKPSFW